MKILATVLINNGILGAAMVLYLAVIWRKNRRKVAEHGWNMEFADPISGKKWLICFIPVLGILYYLSAGETLGIQSVTDKDDMDGCVTVYYGPLSFHYYEDNEMS